MVKSTDVRSTLRFVASAVALVAAFSAQAQSGGLNVTAAGAVIIDADTGKVLWSKDPDTMRCPASTTKIMTALLLLEHCRPEEIITAPSDVNNVGEASLHLQPGEKVTAQEMLYALMLRSANDGCYAVAIHIAGSVPAFAKMMNERAKQIGCSHTHFCNPNGLPNPQHKISPRDLAMIAREAMKRGDFEEVVRQQKHTIARSTNQTDLLLKNRNKYLAMDPTADGIKTGWTIAAGHCYVGSATRDGYRLITVVMKSSDWVTDHKNMLGWAYKFHERRLIAKRGIEIGQLPIKGGLDATIPVGPKNDVYCVVRKHAPPIVEPQIAPGTEVQAPILVGDQVGFAVTQDDTGKPIKIPLVAMADVAVRPMQAGQSLSVVASTMGFVALMGGGALFMRRRSKRVADQFAANGSILKP